MSEEEKYARHHLTHLDFLIYNKLGKNPVLAIEVDGYAYHAHEGRQKQRDAMKDAILEKYDLSLLLFSTTGSGERERLVRRLEGIIITRYRIGKKAIFYIMKNKRLEIAIKTNSGFD